MEVLFTRRSIREFSNRPINREELTKIVRAAMQAPSAVNQQPWRFLVIQKKETLERLSEKISFGKMLRTATAAILVITDKNNLLRDTMYPQDQSAATMNILLQATSLEIGSCWIGVYPNEDKMQMLSSFFDLPTHYEPFSLVALGYPAKEGVFRLVDRFDEFKVFFEEDNARTT